MGGLKKFTAKSASQRAKLNTRELSKNCAASNLTLPAQIVLKAGPVTKIGRPHRGPPLRFDFGDRFTRKISAEFVRDVRLRAGEADGN